jgi:hypothetical protein
MRPRACWWGYAIAVGRSDIKALLKAIIDQGWTDIDIKIVNVRAVGDLVLVANEYTAIGSGQLAGKTLDAKSSHVLVRVGKEWLSTMHTAA